ncbi:MAG: hypothetical protein ABW007_27515 [Chitinophagaceae bacterium]
MARVSDAEVGAWLEVTKLSIPGSGVEDSELLSHMEAEVLIRLSTVYDTSTWLDGVTTPKIVRTIISKMYASFLLDKAYSENQDGGNDYAARLQANADLLITGLVDGLITIPGIDPTVDQTEPSFYPNDASSAQRPTADDMSLGGPWFSLGQAF